jgi:ribosomal protein S18 acetylase RimI-like enzyme
MMSIQKAQTKDDDIVAELIYLAAPTVYQYSFGKNDSVNQDLFTLMVQRPRNMYSREFVTTIAEDNEIQGMILAYPGKRSMELTRGMNKLFWPFIKKIGFWGLMRMGSKSSLNRYYPEPEKDEYYIGNLTVYEQYRGKGLGLALLKEAERQAKNNAFTSSH